MPFAASRAKSYTRYWFVTIDPDVPTKETAESIAQFIDSTLQDSRGWKRFGYNFSRIDPQLGLAKRMESAKNQKYIIHVHLSTEQTIKKACKFGGLNCADLKDNIVFIHYDFWKSGSKASGLDLESYRRYQVNHEFGHLLDRGHKKCSKDISALCPVMYQQTISKGCCKGNPWPLDGE